MSRSRRKPWVTDGQTQHGGRGRTWRKKCHNRIVRRKCQNPDFYMPDGNRHKRGLGLDPWDICDWKFRVEKPLEDRILCWVGEEPYIETYEERLKDYKKARRK